MTEFGLIAPVFFMLLIGLYDIAHMIYARSVFAGAVESAARLSSLETADTSVLDAMVERAIAPVLPGAKPTSQRKSYRDFTDIGRPEQWTDESPNNGGAGDGNGQCDNGEPYTDENDNGQWDADVGRNGSNGGAQDVVIYTASVTYEPLFRVPLMPDSWNERTLTATAVKKNQPFADQAAYSTRTGTCTG